MKKLLLTIAIVTTFGLTASAQCDAYFKWNDSYNEIDRYESPFFVLPQAHGNSFDSNAPLGSGLIILGVLGAGYAIKKKPGDRSQNVGIEF